MERATIMFGGGLPDPDLTPELGPVVAAVLDEEPEAYGYPGQWGHQALRELIAERLARRGAPGFGAGNVVITNGGAGAIGLLSTTLVQPGDVVLVEELTYPGAVAALRHDGATIVPVALDADGLDTVALARVLAELGPSTRPRLVYTIASCHSPTNTILPLERRRQLAELAERFDLLLVQDDTYGEIVFDGPPPVPLLGLAPARTIHVGTFSKTVAPGLRLGYAAGPSWVCEAMAATRSDLGTTPILQRAMARFLADGSYDAQLARITPVYRHKRDLVLEALAQHGAAHGRWRPPAGGFFVWFTLLAGDVEALEQPARDEGVSFLAGPYFSAGATNRTGIRLAYGQLPAADLAEGIARLGRALDRSKELVPT